MTECRDFFDNSSAGHGGSSSLCNHNPGHGKEDVGLDLTLGPSTFSGSSSSPRHQQQHDLVRAVSAFPFLHGHPSGNSASSLPASTASPSHTSPVQSDGFKLPSGHHDVGAALGRQRSGNLPSAGEPSPSPSPFGSQTDAALPVNSLRPPGKGGFPSRDQIWQTLQKSSTLFEQAQHSDDASRMWSRRSASMQAVFPRNGLDNLEHPQIRRSCSNGVSAHGLSRQLSNIEASLDRSPGQSMRYSQPPHQEELEDLKKRKEMQAQRRLEARKRRRILMEEKQHKVCRQGSGLLRHGSKQNISQSDKFSLGGTPSAQDDVAPVSHCLSPDDSKSARSDDLKQGPCKMYKEEMTQDLQEEGKSNMQVSSSVEVDHPSQGPHSGGGNLNASVDVYGGQSVPAVKEILNFLSSEHDSGSHGSMTSSELEQLSDGKYNHQKTHPVTTIPNQTGMPVLRVEGGRSSVSSGTDCIMNSSAPNDTVKEGGLRGIVSSSFSSSPSGCAPLLFSPMQYAYTAGGAAPSTVPNDQVFPFSPFTQYSVAGNVESDPSMQSLPSVQRGSPLVIKNFSGALSSGILLPRTSSVNRDAVGDSEGKQGSSERSAFYPLPRTSSNSKHVFEEAQHSGSHLDVQVSLAASQLSSASNVTSDAANSRNSLLERQPSRPLGARLLSQNSCIEDSAFSCSRQEKSSPGVSLPFEAPTLRLRNSKLKPEEGVKQDEGSYESLLASEHSGLDMAYAQSGVIEKQKSASFPDLPWVTTTGKGPNGKTITGVMYIGNGRQVRLVCSCHGTHMSPVQFVEHSGSSDLSNPERSIVVSPFPHLNYQVASTTV